jgi:hypothetical protein
VQCFVWLGGHIEFSDLQADDPGVAMGWTGSGRVVTQIEAEGFLDSCPIVRSDFVAESETIGESSLH